jgi:hypothetical protein
VSGKSAVDIEIRGDTEIISKAKVIGADSAKMALARLGISLLNKATLLSPVKSGRTRGSLKKGAAGNVWIESSSALLIGSTVQADGFYYPRALDEGGALDYSYASGPFQGKPLSGWFTQIASRSEADVRAALDAAKQELLKKWGR